MNKGIIVNPLITEVDRTKPAHELPYYKRYLVYPDLPMPNEPSNDFEHPVRWALLAYWHKAQLEKVQALIKAYEECLTEMLGNFEGMYEGYSTYLENIAAARKELGL